MQFVSIPSLAHVSRDAWNALCPPNDPFVRYDFLRALEESGSVGPGTGWEPCHALVHAPGGALVAAAPLYLKTHSYGEYIFDFGWANAAHRAGLAYYPKLVSAVPFTPATGRRLLGADRNAVSTLVHGILGLADTAAASSVHILFLTAEEQRGLVGEFPFQARLSYQFHWENAGYENFEHYLAGFRAQVRKQIRKERRLAQESGLRLATKPGTELSADEWRVLDLVYRQTAERKGGHAYLTEPFFELLRERLAANVVASLAYEGGRPVAAALALTQGEHLYGRYWGTLVPVEGLHFELCYYQLIDYAIANRFSRFEAGAQGEHKLKRGFLPSPTYSAHWLRHPGLAEAVGDFLRRETAAMQEEMELLAGHSPFHKVTSA